MFQMTVLFAERAKNTNICQWRFCPDT